MNFRLIQQALVALEMYRECTPEGNGVAEQAIVALKQFKKEWEETEVPYVVVECNCSGKTTLLSTPQRTWVGLTDEEILAVNMSTVTKLIDEPIVCDTDHNIVQLGKAIEAKLKEKNT